MKIDINISNDELEDMEDFLCHSFLFDDDISDEIKEKRKTCFHIWSKLCCAFDKSEEYEDNDEYIHN